MSAKPFDDAVGAIFETLEPLSPVILRTLAAGLELAAEASGRGPREEPLYTLAGAMELFAGDMEPGADGPGRWRSSG